MADAADRAGGSIERAATAGIDRVRDAMRRARSSTHCHECGDEIPRERREAITTTLCAPCQAERESLAARGR